jgi:hypothetical protein
MFRRFICRVNQSLRLLTPAETGRGCFYYGAAVLAPLQMVTTWEHELLAGQTEGQAARLFGTGAALAVGTGVIGYAAHRFNKFSLGHIVSLHAIYFAGPSVAALSDWAYKTRT